VEIVGRVKQSLGGNAADIETGTSEGSSLFNADGLETSLACLDGSHVAAWTSANDTNVILAVRKVHCGEIEKGAVGHADLLSVIESSGKHIYSLFLMQFFCDCTFACLSLLECL
jgi:hypothetical protein